MSLCRNHIVFVLYEEGSQNLFVVSNYKIVVTNYYLFVVSKLVILLMYLTSKNYIIRNGTT